MIYILIDLIVFMVSVACTGYQVDAGHYGLATANAFASLLVLGLAFFQIYFQSGRK